MTDAELPAEMRLAIDAATRRLDGGRVLIGGSPLRLLRLTETGARTADALWAGEPVGDRRGARRLARRLLDAGAAHPRPRRGPFGPDDVTVVIPVLDDVDALATTLRAIEAAAPGPARVVVVDDGSADPGPIADTATRHRATVVRRSVTGGPAAARNRGLAEVTTPLVAFVDADVAPEAAWLPTLLPQFADPAVVAVAPRVRARPGPAGGADGVLSRFEREHSPLDLGPHEARVAASTRIAYVPSTALLARTEAVAAVGGFDEGLRFGEDVDLGWRLVAEGGTVRYAPTATVTHPTRRDLWAWLRQRFDYGSSAAPLARRHPGALAPVRVSAWSAAAWGLVAIGQPGPGLALALGATAALPSRLGPLEHPWRESLRLAGVGTWAAWRPLAAAITRVWWPVALAAAVVSRRARRVVLAAALVPSLLDWADGERALDPLRYTALHLLDDAAYGAGVWVGCLRERDAAALAPDLASWPGRRTGVHSPEIATPGGPPP